MLQAFKYHEQRYLCVHHTFMILEIYRALFNNLLRILGREELAFVLSFEDGIFEKKNVSLANIRRVHLYSYFYSLQSHIFKRLGYARVLKC